MQESTRHIEPRLPPSMEALARDAGNSALFLDCDGTLLDIALSPGSVTVPAGLVELLVRVSKRLDGALAILSGRQLAEIDHLLAPAKLIGAGVHGGELRTTLGGPITQVATSLPNSLVERVADVSRRMPGIIAEPKGPGLAVHYRLAPDMKEAVEAVLRTILSGYDGALVLCPGRKLFEIIPRGHSKGTALETLAALPTFHGRRPIMIGDDVGDEPAIAAAMRLGGYGLRVAGEHFGPARADLAGPRSVLAWLEELAQRLDA